MDSLSFWIAILLALAVGTALGAGWATARARGAAPRVDPAIEVASLVGPLRQSLADLQASVQRADADRASGVGRLEHHLQAIAQEQRYVAEQTSSVVAALRNPGVRGRWGEVQLTRIVESAGLLEGVTFHTQQGDAAGGRLRPDMVIDLGAGRRVVVDSKVPLDALLTAYEDCPGGEPDPAALRAHAHALRARIRDLAGKDYAAHLPQSPDFVVLFLPAEELLTTALRADPGIVDDAAQAGVILATPTTLLTLLRIVALTWQEDRARRNATEVLDLATQAVHRVGLLAGHLQTLGARLDATVEAYNKVAGSWQSRVRPVARRLTEFGSDGDRIDDLAAIDTDVRRIDNLTDTA